MDDPVKIYKQRRREARSRKPELVDPKVEADGSSSSPQATPPTSPKEAPLHQGMALPEHRSMILRHFDDRGISTWNIDNVHIDMTATTSRFAL